MEINTKILDIKNRVGKNSNKIYWSIETDDGNMNCHEESVVEKIRPFINGMCTLAVRETPKADGNGVWQNVTGLIEEGSSEDNADKKSLLKTDEQVKEVRKSVKGSAYEKDPVGLAVEVFVSLNYLNPDVEPQDGKLMEEAIALVKQAQVAFS